MSDDDLLIKPKEPAKTKEEIAHEAIAMKGSEALNRVLQQIIQHCRSNKVPVEMCVNLILSMLAGAMLWTENILGEAGNGRAIAFLCQAAEIQKQEKH